MKILKAALVLPLSCCLLLFIPATGLTQKRGADLIDSLEKRLAQQNEDTNKVYTLMRISAAYSLTEMDKAFPTVNEALRLSEKLHWIKGIANSENNLGLFMSDTGNATGARKHFEISYKYNVQRGSRINVVNNLVNIGRTYSFESDFPKAVDYFYQALTVAEEIHDEQKMALVGNNLAGSFLRQHNPQKGLEYGLYTLDHAGKAADSSSMIKGLCFMGAAQVLLKDTAAAILSLDRAVAIGKASGLLIDMSDALGDRAALEPDMNKRITLELDAEKLYAKASPNSTGHLLNMANLGFSYLALAKNSSPAEKSRLLKMSEEYLENARVMAVSRNNPQRLAEVLIMIVELEEYQGRYQKALADHKRMTQINDSLFSQENKNKIAGQETRHTVALKDAELAISQLKLSDQRKATIGLIAGLALLSLLGIMLYVQSRSRKKANTALMRANQELEEANRIKARFFGILSHDLRGPVASLLHFLEIRKLAPELMNSSQQDKHEAEISSAAENLLSTMESMLLWSKQQMQSFRPVFKNIPVDGLFDYLRKFFGIPDDVVIIFVPATGDSVYSDENYLRTIMQNLTSNAIHALTGQEGARIEWKSIRSGEDLILSISDNGPGLRPEFAKALYEESVTENTRSGFGLHMTRDLAKAIHCRIDVETLPGKGTKLLLTIPGRPSTII